MQFWVHILSFPFFFPFFFSLSLCKLYFKLPFLVRILVILQHSASSIYTKQCLTLINYSCISSPCKTCCLHWEHNFFHQVSLSFCLYLCLFKTVPLQQLNVLVIFTGYKYYSQLRDQVLKTLPVPHITLFLDASPVECHQRIHGRGRVRSEI